MERRSATDGLRVSAATGRAHVAVIVSIVILSALVIHNIYWTIQNQTGRQGLIKFRVLPRDIARVAARTPSPKVTRYAVYYWIDKNVHGDTLTIPKWLRRERRVIKAMTGMNVSVARRELLVNPKKQGDLRAESRAQYRYLADDATRTFATMYFILEPGARKYVIAEGGSKEKGMELFLLPATRVAAVQAATTASGPVP